MSERALSGAAGLQLQDDFIFWDPGQLQSLAELIPPDLPTALYGRGPVWLAGFIAAYTHPAPMALFDLRFDWLDLPPVSNAENPNLEITLQTWSPSAIWISYRLPETFLTPDHLVSPQIPVKKGVVLSGKLPRWAFAALLPPPERLDWVR